MAAKAAFRHSYTPTYTSLQLPFTGPTKVLNVRGSGDDFASSGLPRTLGLGRAWYHGVFGDLLAVGNEDGVVRTWDLSTVTQCSSTQCSSFRDHEDGIKAPLIASDSTIITGAADGTIIAWDVALGNRQRTFLDHNSSILGLRVHRENTLVPSDLHGMAQLWTLDDGACIQTLQGHTNYVGILGVSDDGQFLATGEGGGMFKIWSCSSGELIATCSRHTKNVTQFHNIANDTLMTAAADGAICAWRWTTGELLCAHNDAVRDFVVADSHFITAGMDGKMRLWALEEMSY